MARVATEPSHLSGKLNGVATTNTPLRDVLGGKASTSLGKAFGLQTVGELLRHYPRRYTERGELTDLAQLVEGEEVTVQAEVRSVKARRIPGRKLNLLEVTIVSGTGQATLSFFNQMWRERELRPGTRGLFAGKVTRFRNTLQLNSPDYLLLPDETDELVAAEADDFAGVLIPVYPASSALPSWTIARCVRIVLDSLDPVEDPVPSMVLAAHGLMDLDPALREIHRPADRPGQRAARRRLAFDEAFGVQLVMAQRRHESVANPAVARPPVVGGLASAFAERLPFTLTREQAEILAQIESDLASGHPMHRLLQGEVGSGKTVVALQAMLQVVDCGGQAALLAPTEVLAAQHEQTVLDLLGPLGQPGRLGGDERATGVVLLTGSMSAASRRAALLDAAPGAAGIVIGTHALIQDNVQFADLGLVVIDEQHRFGVEQRDALRAKAAKPPHVLVMTATPIPRTVAITVYGDLDVSELHELPAGRAAISTTVVPVQDRPNWMARVWQRVSEEVGNGRQVFVVCPRIGDDDVAAPEDVPELDEDGQAAGVLATFDELANGVLAGLRVDVMHGRLSPERKSAAMASFSAGTTDVLVSTTVIEVGVNMPNASMVVVLDADRFGVSQLHQLRGRIGRGEHAGLCLLVTRMPDGHPARERLAGVAATLDGFALAEQDLSARREGDVLGASQSGRRSQLKLLSLLHDRELIEIARTEARAVIEADPALTDHPRLEDFLRQTLDIERAEFLTKS